MTRRAHHGLFCLKLFLSSIVYLLSWWHPVTAMSRRLELTVPTGSTCGDCVAFTDPFSGQIMQTTVPDGLAVGDAFEVEIESVSLSTGSADSEIGIADHSPSPPPPPHHQQQMALYAPEELRLPRAADGFRFYVGQHVQLERSDGKLQNGIVLECIEAFENLYADCVR
jgi:hypothetical protein